MRQEFFTIRFSATRNIDMIYLIAHPKKNAEKRQV